MTNITHTHYTGRPMAQKGYWDNVIDLFMYKFIVSFLLCGNHYWCGVVMCAVPAGTTCHLSHRASVLIAHCKYQRTRSKTLQTQLRSRRYCALVGSYDKWLTDSRWLYTAGCSMHGHLSTLCLKKRPPPHQGRIQELSLIHISEPTRPY